MIELNRTANNLQHNQQNKYTRITKSRIFQEGRLSQTEREIEQMTNANRIERQNQLQILETQNLEYFRRGV